MRVINHLDQGERRAGNGLTGWNFAGLDRLIESMLPPLPHGCEPVPDEPLVRKYKKPRRTTPEKARRALERAMRAAIKEIG